MLKFTYDKKEDIPADAVGLYKETDGKWSLNVDGAPKDSRINEFRDTNRQLQGDVDRLTGELSTLRKQYEGITPEAFDEFRQQLDKVKADEERSLLAAGKVDEVITRRMAAANDAHAHDMKAKDDAYATLSQERDALKGRLGKLLIDQSVQTALGEAQIRMKPGALDDVTARARRNWKINDKGEAQPVTVQDGETVTLYGAKGDPMTMGEYVRTELLGKAPHLFEAASGGGAPGNPSGGGDSGGKKTIAAGDSAAFSQNLEGLAKGEVVEG